MKPDGLPIEERAERTRSRLRNVGNIPTLPPVLIQVWELTTQENTSASDLGKAIGADPGLTGALLRLANSAYFGFPRKVATVTQAVVILGFDTVKSLAMGASVFRALGSRGGPIDAEAFFRHSLVCALGARLVMERRSPGKAGTAFCGGILHDLGRLVIAEFLPKSLQEIEARRAKGETAEEAEIAELGLSHAGIGQWFAVSWNFPDELAAAVAWHHAPGNAPEHAEFAAAVHLGDVLAHRAGATGGRGAAPPEPQPFALETMGLDAGELDRLLEKVRAQMIESGPAGATLGVT
jgi:HD-like signal output (HDOD) protein